MSQSVALMALVALVALRMADFDKNIRFDTQARYFAPVQDSWQGPGKPLHNKRWDLRQHQPLAV